MRQPYFGISVRLAAFPEVAVILLAGFIVSSCGPILPPPNRQTISIGHTLAVRGSSEHVGVLTVASMLSEEGLTTRTGSGRETFTLAEHWQLSPDGLTLSVSLRPGVKFHDGSELTSDLVRESLNRSRENDGDLAEYPMLTEISEVAAPEKKLLTVRFKRASVFAPDDLSVPIVKIDSAGRRVGTGPYFIAKTDPEVFRLDAFHQYHRGRPFIDSIELRGFPSLRAAWSALMRQEIDALYEVPLESREFMEGESSVRVYPFTRSNAHALVFNMRRPLWQSKERRRSLAAVVDRSALITRAFRDHARPAIGPLLDWSPTRSRAGAGSGSADISTAGSRPQSYTSTEASALSRAESKRLQFSCLLLNRTSTDEQVALVLQRQLYDAGVDMVIEASRLSDFVRRVGEGKYDALLLDVYAGSNLSFQYAFWHSSFTNWWANFGYSGADKELDALRAARSDADMRAALAELKRVFTDDPPAVFLAWTETARVVSRRLEVPYEAGEDIIRDLWRWRPRRETGAPLAYAANDNN